ncbi:hypothetical protein ABVT39_019057 [Epinephelus coioides]
MNKDVLREMKIKMNIAYCVAKEVHKKNGTNVSATYDNHVRCAEMIGQIAGVMKCELATKVKHTHYLSIMTDGDMDVSTKECEVVYARLIKDGKPVNKLVGQQEVQHGHAKGRMSSCCLAGCLDEKEEEEEEEEEELDAFIRCITSPRANPLLSDTGF